MMERGDIGPLIVVGALAFMCAKCHSADLPAIAEEAAFQIVHAADMQQTLGMGRKACAVTGEDAAREWTAEVCSVHHERSALIDAGWAIGPHPSDRSVYAYFGAESLVHLAVTTALVQWAPRWAVHSWEMVTITVSGATVERNARIGLAVRL